MSRRRTVHAAQLGFGNLLAEADSANAQAQQHRACAHLPGTLEEAVPFFRALIERHHAAMVTGDAETVMALRKDARQLASKLNNFEPGIMAGDDAPGSVLERATRAPEGTLPLWGQSGSFEIACGAMRVRIEMQGIFGLASSVYHWLGLGAYAVDQNAPFLSETGFRSFIAIGGELEPGFTPDAMAAVIAEHVKRELKGKLVVIKTEFRERVPEGRP